MAVELFNFEKKRTFGGAFGITLMYSVIGILLAGIVAGIAQMFNPSATFEEGLVAGQKIGKYFVVFYITIISILILYKKLFLITFGQ